MSTIEHVGAPPLPDATPAYRSVDLYRTALTIRRVEETLLRLHGEGAIAGTVHTCIGQEACAAGVVSALDRDRDVIWSNHRGHGHYLAYCDDVDGLIAEVLGRETGVCRGIGGSQHLHRDNFYSNGILGGTAPCAVGSALAEKLARYGRDRLPVPGRRSIGRGRRPREPEHGCPVGAAVARLRGGQRVRAVHPDRARARRRHRPPSRLLRDRELAVGGDRHPRSRGARGRRSSSRCARPPSRISSSSTPTGWRRIPRATI